MADEIKEQAAVPESEAASPHGLEPAPEINQLQAELDQARAEATENLDKFLRSRADMENQRKRAEIELGNSRKYAIERFAAEIVNVRDSLELARGVELSEGASPAVQKMHEGLDLTLKVLDSTFQKFGITVVDPQGQKFDPEKHQAISTVESAEVPANHVVTVVQKGFLLNDRLLRPAMVVVARAPAVEGTLGA